jgi:hypothetical protein
MCADGQSFVFPPGRIVTLPGRSLSDPSKGVEPLVMSRYVAHSIFLVLFTLLLSQILVDDNERIAEVYFFIHLRHNGIEMGLALVSLYSEPHRDLLQISHGTLWSSEYHGDSALKFVDVKAIKSVVAMIPHSPVIRGQEARARFFLVEKPGFDVAIIAGIEEGMPGEENGG